jgi:uncharacterized protein YbcC (UPF0753/DUF2309 family)
VVKDDVTGAPWARPTPPSLPVSLESRMSASRSMHARADDDRGVRLNADEPRGELAELAEVIERAAHLLPQQGPITVFIHHNTLHAFEDLPFHDAIRKGAQVFGCQPYLNEDRYRDELRRGRIRFAELQEVVEGDLGDKARETIPGFGARIDLRLAMLQYPLRIGPTEELLWYVAEHDSLRRVRAEASSAIRARLIAETRRWVMRELRNGKEAPSGASTGGAGDRSARESLAGLLDRFGESTIEGWSDDDWERFTLQALWRVCCDGVRDLPPFTPQPLTPVRHRDFLLEASGEDADALVNGMLIRFCSAFLDQGLAAWQLPSRDEGFLRSFCALYRRPGGPPARWMDGLAAELAWLQDEQVGPLESIRQSLDALGVGRAEWEPFLSATLLVLRGWAGMVRQIEEREDRVVHPVPRGSLVEFLAVRLLLDRYALAHTAREALGFDGPLAELRRAIRGEPGVTWPPSVEQRAFLVFQLAQIVGLSPDLLHRLTRPEWEKILEEIETFSALERRRVFHLAYERRFYHQALDAIGLHARQPAAPRPLPRFQVVTCIDEREESFRRHLEELAPHSETFGTAGFFSVAIYYRGAADAHFVPLCPAVLRPRHWVVERVVDMNGEDNHRRARTRRMLGIASHRIHTGSRSVTQGALLAAIGVVATIPLVARTLFPRLTARLRKSLLRIVLEPPLTRLQLERLDPEPGLEDHGIGFTLDEMTDIAEKVLREIGLTTRFSRLVVILGHGSTSMNNPHESAHDCGACGGSRGGPNARALAQIFNDPRVRERLAGRGLTIPSETRFIGGMHNTSSDEVTFFDRDLIPGYHRQEFEGVRSIIDHACERNAHERCRRFLSAPLTLSFAGARQHVEARAEDLAQVRPEWGHATNAITIVGRREWTRGLFLDRRAFLTSYDPAQDDAERSVLARILSAVFPVCSGISLEYYFSYVDNSGWGCGTKLPHNITSLVGVMDGYQSDLRTGLPWQMVEVHEPVRPLFVIETTREAMFAIMGRDVGIRRLCAHGWVTLALIDPGSREISIFQDGSFRTYTPRSRELPRASSSVDWYRGWRDHLEFAEIAESGAAGTREPFAVRSPLGETHHATTMPVGRGSEK